MASQVEYQDIITQKPTPIKLICDEKTKELIKDANYFPIIKILRKGPMSVRELEKAYCEEANEERSCKTIYRYLKILENADLVVPVGQRVIIGKTATETLYGRTASVFEFSDMEEQWWHSEDAEGMVMKIGILVSTVLRRKTPPTKRLQEFISKFESTKLSILKELVKNEKKLLETHIDGTFKENVILMEYVRLFAAILTQGNLLEQLFSCFNEEKTLTAIV